MIVKPFDALFLILDFSFLKILYKELHNSGCKTEKVESRTWLTLWLSNLLNYVFKNFAL